MFKYTFHLLSIHEGVLRNTSEVDLRYCVNGNNNMPLIMTNGRMGEVHGDYEIEYPYCRCNDFRGSYCIVVKTIPYIKSKLSNSSNNHICEYIDVGFMHPKFVCKICNKDKPE